MPGPTPPVAEHGEEPPSGDGAHTARRVRRRVTTEPPPGSDPTPTPEAPRHRAAENDEQLRRDKPPHWG